MVNLTELLEYIPPSSLTYQEWCSVGMALKHEGYDCSVWDAWSRADNRYKSRECSRKWDSFKEGTGTIVTGGTIYELASRFGYSPDHSVRTFDWDDEIEYDGDTVIKDTAWLDMTNTIREPDHVGADELRRYLQALFKPDEIVGFCIDARFDEERGKWFPGSKGSYGFTAKHLLEGIKKHPDDINAVIGDYNRDAGAWIRFNPLDGQGVGNSNVSDFRYALVESDDMEIEKQKAIMEELKLPVAVMVYSGGKSVHSIVKINAYTMEEYKERVDYLYKKCRKNGLKIDENNKNPSRLSRMPGVERKDKKQFIIAENIGLSSFEEWKEYIESLEDTLPDIVTFSDLKELPPLSPELIGGLLRKGHKMLIAGASKAGKSFLLIELALSIAEGVEWLGFQCMKGRVLYINFEVDGSSFLHRVSDVCARMGIGHPNGLDVWNLRGENLNIEKLAPKLMRRAEGKGYDAIILDPLYKINQSDENSARDMAVFFNQLDAICVRLKTSVICCHHHSKGAQGHKASADRSSGSGVFARDPDALMDMLQIDPADAGKSLMDGQTAWRISFTLREFRTPKDIDVIFDFPVHEITLDLKDAKPISGQSKETNSKRGNDRKAANAEEKYQRLLGYVENWEDINTDPKKLNPTIADAEEYFKNDRGFSKRSIRRWIDEHDDIVMQNGILYLKNDESE